MHPTRPKPRMMAWPRRTASTHGPASPARRNPHPAASAPDRVRQRPRGLVNERREHDADRRAGQHQVEDGVALRMQVIPDPRQQEGELGRDRWRVPHRTAVRTQHLHHQRDRYRDAALDHDDQEDRHRQQRQVPARGRDRPQTKKTTPRVSRNGMMSPGSGGKDPDSPTTIPQTKARSAKRQPEEGRAIRQAERGHRHQTESTKTSRLRSSATQSKNPGQHPQTHRDRQILCRPWSLPRAMSRARFVLSVAIAERTTIRITVAEVLDRRARRSVRRPWGDSISPVSPTT